MNKLEFIVKVVEKQLEVQDRSSIDCAVSFACFCFDKNQSGAMCIANAVRYGKWVGRN